MSSRQGQVINLAERRAERLARTGVPGPGQAPAVPLRIVWVPMMMMVPVAVPIAPADRTHAG